MAAIVKKAGVEEDAPQVHRIRITLTSKNVKNLEKVSNGSAEECCKEGPCDDATAMHTAVQTGIGSGPMELCTSCQRTSHAHSGGSDA